MSTFAYFMFLPIFILGIIIGNYVRSHIEKGRVAIRDEKIKEQQNVLNEYEKKLFSSLPPNAPVEFKDEGGFFSSFKSVFKSAFGL